MDIADDLLQVGVLLAEDRVKSLLKDMAGSPLSPVQVSSITREEKSHEIGDREERPLQQKMNVVRHQAIGKTAEGAIRLQFRKCGEKELPVVGAVEDLSPRIASSRDVKDCAWGINAR